MSFPLLNNLKLRVAHKGLLIVLTVLVLELILINVLTWLLIATDHEHAKEALLRDRAMYEARLMCADIDCGGALIRAWRFQRLDYLDKLKDSSAQSEQIETTLRTIYDKIDGGITAPHKELLDNHRLAIGIVRRIGEITSQGFSLDTLHQMIEAKHELTEMVEPNLADVQRYHADTTVAIAASSKNLQLLITLQGVAIGIGILLQAVVAVLLAGYFSREFVYTLESIRINVDRMSKGHPLREPLSGTDEIVELDNAFLKMAQELALAGAREQALFDNASDIICVIDQDLRILKINSACTSVWGYPALAITRAKIESLIPETEWRSMQSAFTNSRDNDPSAVFQCEVKVNSGQTIRCEWSTFWSERDKCWFCVVHDVTEQHRLQKLKDSFLSMITKDLQAPLHKTYDLFASVSAAGITSEKGGTAIANALKTLQRLKELVAELLNFERLQSVESKADLALYDISEMLASAVRDVGTLAAGKSIKIDTQYDSAECICDYSKIVRVLVNLLSNAIKYSPPNSTILVKAHKENGSVVFQIIDQGPGIAPAAAEGLFQPFAQVDASDAKRGKGTGLGLAICKQLVELHQGEIGIESAVGKGSTFWFRLPIAMPGKSAALVPSDARHRTAKTNLRKVGEDSLSEQRKHARSGFIESLGLKKIRLALIGLPLAFECIFVACLAILLIQGNAERAKEIQESSLAEATINLSMGYCNLAAAVEDHSGHCNFEKLSQTLKDIKRMSRQIKTFSESDKLLQEDLNAIFQLNDVLQPLVEETGQRLLQSGDDIAPDKKDGFGDKFLLVAGRINQPIMKYVSDCQPRQRLSPEKQQNIRREQGILLAVAVVINILLATAAAALFSRSITRRLKVMVQNTTLLAGNKALLPPVGGTDEIGQLDISFHSMAEQLYEQRQKERAYLDTSRDVIGSLSPALRLVTLSPAAETLWGVKNSPDDPIWIRDLLQDEDRDVFADTLRALRFSNEAAHFETRMRAPASPYMLWSASWSEKEQCYFFVAHDVSKRKQLEIMKREFFSVVSHDLRTPLGTLFGISELMLAGTYGPIPQTSVVFMQQVRFHLDQMLELINDLLDLEKMNAGQMQLTMDDASLSDVLQNVTKYSLALVESRKQKFFVAPIDLDDLEFSVDFERIVQALCNLISAASQVAAQDSVISIATDARGGFINLTVAVSGVSVAAATRSLLEAQLDNAPVVAETAQEGSRLRLALAKMIIASHGGSVHVAGDPTIPALFSIVLPQIG